MSIFEIFKSKPKIEGEIGFQGLADWWLSAFTESERSYIEQVYKPLSIGGENERPLTRGKILSMSQTAAGFLVGLASWFRKTTELTIAQRILEKADSLVGKTTLDKHFAYQGMIEVFYKNRKNPESLRAAIQACQKQIELAPLATKAFREEFGDSQLPRHVGYEQLSIILEKEGNYKEAIRVCTQAKRQGWNGDWDKKIERCEIRASRTK